MSPTVPYSNYVPPASKIARRVCALFFIGTPFVLWACVSRQEIIFLPDPEPVPVQADLANPGRIIETQNGAANVPIPEWLDRFLGRPVGRPRGARSGNGRLRQVENTAAYRNTYTFIGNNRGINRDALHQWALELTVAQDFPRLVARRIENRLVEAATLYPDDEYGGFFEAVIKNASDAEYPEAVKKEMFWIKWRNDGNDATVSDPELSGLSEAERDAKRELYEFFVLISIDKSRLQTRIQELLENTQAAVPPTRDQAAAIHRIRQHFFEVF
jgi:hypothetical protein